MAPDFFMLEFDGYWRDANVEGVPAQPGIYCVYSCAYNSDNKTISINKLLYIGESENVKERIIGHELKVEWTGHLKSGQQLCYNFAKIVFGRERAEATLINHHQPLLNSEYKSHFPYDETDVVISGKHKYLDTNVYVPAVNDQKII